MDEGLALGIQLSYPLSHLAAAEAAAELEHLSAWLKWWDAVCRCRPRVLLNRKPLTPRPHWYEAKCVKSLVAVAGFYLQDRAGLLVEVRSDHRRMVDRVFRRYACGPVDRPLCTFCSGPRMTQINRKWDVHDFTGHFLRINSERGMTPHSETV